MSNIKAKNFAIKLLESIMVIGYILFEELVWNVFAKPIFQYLKSLAILKSAKKIFLGLNRYLLLAVFILILAITEGLGFLAGYYFVKGHFFTGMTVYASKIPIASFTFWLFDLTKDKLMTFHWLKITYDYLLTLIESFTHSSLYIYTKKRVSTVRAKIKSLVFQYFGEEGFIASVKAHYYAFKPYLVNLLK